MQSFRVSSELPGVRGRAFDLPTYSNRDNGPPIMLGLKSGSEISEVVMKLQRTTAQFHETHCGLNRYPPPTIPSATVTAVADAEFRTHDRAIGSQKVN